MLSNILTPYTLCSFFVFLVGACLGSFLNLAIYRIPLHLSVVFPRSHCPSCKKNIQNRGLIPILGFFLLKGKCFYCQNKISRQYPLVELFCAVGTLLLFQKFFHQDYFLELFLGKTFHFKILLPFLLSLWLFYTGILLSFIDIKHRILPDVVTIPGIFIGLILSSGYQGFLNSFFGALLGFFGLFLFTKLYFLLRKKEGMGFGDVKYLGFLGAVVGPLGVLYTLFFASVLGSFVGIIYGLFTKKGLSESIPFGPFLSSSALFVFLFFLC